MLNDGLPVRVDPMRLAGQRKKLSGELPLSGLARLGASLANREGTVRVELEFGIGQAGVRFAEGRISADVELVCQRCLEPLHTTLLATPTLGLIESEAEAALLPEGYDPLLVENGELFLRELVEDELILSLPIVARHEDAACMGEGVDGTGEDTQAEARENPFAVLSVLKHDSNS